MTFADKLVDLRRKKGLSQEMLADLLNVSRQAVSKWEAGRAMPDLPKLVAMAEMFEVSLDELVRDRDPAEAAPAGPMVVGPLAPAGRRREYTSRTRLFGVPLVHLCFGQYGGPVGVARGIVAIGDIAVGALAFGGIAVGGVAVGGLSAGLLLALGGVAVGGIALGGLALGIFALGGFALGLYAALGGGAVAGQLAGGGFASAKVAVGASAYGDLAFTADNLPATLAEFQQAVRGLVSGAPAFLLRLLYALLRAG